MAEVLKKQDAAPGVVRVSGPPSTLCPGGPRRRLSIPPEHRDGVVQSTKADDAEDHFDGVTSE